jgi:hypothetical protein
MTSRRFSRELLACPLQPAVIVCEEIRGVCHVVWSWFAGSRSPRELAASGGLGGGDCEGVVSEVGDEV